MIHPVNNQRPVTIHENLDGTKMYHRGSDVGVMSPAIGDHKPRSGNPLMEWVQEKEWSTRSIQSVDPKTQWEWYVGSKIVLQYPDGSVIKWSQWLPLFSFISLSLFLPSLLAFYNKLLTYSLQLELPLGTQRMYLTWSMCVCFFTYPKSQLFHLLIHTWIFTEYFPWNCPWWVPETHSPTGEVEAGLLGDYVTCPAYSVWNQKTLHKDESCFKMHPQDLSPILFSYAIFFK